MDFAGNIGRAERAIRVRRTISEKQPPVEIRAICSVSRRRCHPDPIEISQHGTHAAVVGTGVDSWAVACRGARRRSLQ